MTIRAATRDDMPRVLALVQELADYEKLEGPDAAAQARLVADAFETGRIQAWVAEEAGGIVGYALTFEAYSSFRARPILYLEDLYVTPARRQAGLGTAFLARLAAEARRRGCARMAWTALDWNTPARRFYEKLGATSGWVYYNLEGEALERLAARAGKE